MPNAEQVEYWDGAGGEHWAREAETYDRLNAAFARAIVDRLDPQAGERVLDLGCGNGALALAVAPVVGSAGSVTGLDLSGPMLAVARSRAAAAGLDNVEFVQGDAQVASLPDASFDAAVSRFGVMFFDDPVVAFGNVRRMLRPAGRLVFACWQELFANEWLMVPAAAMLAHVPLPQLDEPGAPGPFAFADADRVRSLLGEAGFADVALDDVKAAMDFGPTVDDAVAFMQGTDLSARLLQDADEETKARAWDSVREALAAHAGPEGVRLTGAAWLVTARVPST